MCNMVMQIKSSGGSEKFRYKITEQGIRLTQISKEIENRVGLDWIRDWSSGLWFNK